MEIKLEILNPTINNYNTIFEQQFEFRKNNKFTGGNWAAIGIVESPFWWNRPLQKNSNKAKLVKLETNGLYSVNLPLILENIPWKSEYNLLVTKESIPFLIQLKFKKTISNSGRQQLHELLQNTIIKTLLDIEIPKSSIVSLNNDILLNGKKIAGFEYCLKENIYCCDGILTLRFKQDSKLFDKLSYGKAKPKTAISGVFDEFKINYTKQECLNIFKSNLEYFINQAIQNDPLDE